MSNAGRGTKINVFATKCFRLGEKQKGMLEIYILTTYAQMTTMKHQERKYHKACFQLVFKAEVFYEGRKASQTPGGVGSWDASTGSPAIVRGGNGLPVEGTV